MEIILYQNGEEIMRQDYKHAVPKVVGWSLFGCADGEAGSTPRSFTIGVPEDHVDLPIARLDLRSPSMQDSIDALPLLKTCIPGSPYPRGEEITFSYLPEYTLKARTDKTRRTSCLAAITTAAYCLRFSLLF